MNRYHNDYPGLCAMSGCAECAAVVAAAEPTSGVFACQPEDIAVAPRTVKCDKCCRIVPVAPGFRNVSVPHVSRDVPWETDSMVGICKGNRLRESRDEYVPDGWMLALQHNILDTDAYWEGL